ncbi:MAG: hypothetical protein O2899_07810 [Bacteroidetes bacterium]|nr:hypothetical protein [Bacteroidota bacterium]
MPESTIVKARLRGILCSLAVLVFLFTPLELLLLEHTGDWIQLIPFAASFFGIVAAGWVLVSPSRLRIIGARLLAAGIIGVTLIGVVKHFQENLELELEVRPGTGWPDVWQDALFGAAPFLASGILLLGALLIIGATYAHPALTSPKTD